MMKTDATTGAVERAKRAIRELVSAGDLVPGQRLVEPDLAAQLAVSRATLREAFSALEGEGLLKIERYKGASVRRLDARDVIESFEVRELLEGLAARRAAAHFSKDPARARLVALAQAMEKSAVSGKGLQEFSRLNTRFHDLILHSANSDQLLGMSQYLRPPAVVRLVHQQLADADAIQRSVAEHREICAALLDGEAERAEAAMRRHVRSTMRALARAVDARKWERA